MKCVTEHLGIERRILFALVNIDVGLVADSKAFAAESAVSVSRLSSEAVSSSLSQAAEHTAHSMQHTVPI